jgi:subtilisin family serine protease
VVLHAPERLSTRRALSRLRALDPNGAYDYNHIYLDSGAIEAARPAAEGDEVSFAPAAADAGERHQKRHGTMASSRLMLAEPAQSASGSPVEAPSSSVKIGLIDGGVDLNHAVFQGATIHTHGCNDKNIPSPHGTAVASLIIGRTDLFHGAAPGAELYAADVYCGVGTGGAVDAVVEAIAWIAREHVPVINVSLVGPRNITLENVVKLVIARGYIVVAAVGNDGAAAPPLYPASYAGVIGVTGVDARQKVLVEACRGPQVDFAAPGADMAAAMLAPAFAAVRGTSFAAPIVAGLLAAELHEPNAAAAEKAIVQLSQQAQDLGARGFDKVYGNGLVGNAVRTAPALALVGPSPGHRPD